MLDNHFPSVLRALPIETRGAMCPIMATKPKVVFLKVTYTDKMSFLVSMLFDIEKFQSQLLCKETADATFLKEMMSFGEGFRSTKENKEMRILDI